MEKPMELLFTLDENYLPHLKVALLSIRLNDLKGKFRVWLVHENISKKGIMSLKEFCRKIDFTFEEIKVDGSQWENAPTEDRYPKEMYFRLLAGEFLPKEIKKVLYLDPDILVINSLQELWETELENHLLGAAVHKGLTDIVTPINKVRLDLDHGYYNSGVLLMNLEKAREMISWQDISEVIEEHSAYLVLPDQDILNFLYGKYALLLPEEKWNYDARMYAKYFARSLGEYDTQWTMANTSILHFCGKNKPWKESHDNRFTALYLSYQKIAESISQK